MPVLLVEGWGGSGKSLLLSYLDSHPEIFAIPVHDKLVYDVLGLNSQSLHTNDKDIRHIRKILSSHGYYNIEYNATREVIPVLLSTKKDDILEIPFKFSFEEFERSWKRAALETKSFTKGVLIDILYGAFYENAETHKEKNKIKLFATMGDAKSCSPQKFLENYPLSKLVYVKRSVEELIAIRSNRKTPTGLSKGMFEKDFLTVILSGEIQRIIDYERKVHKASRLHPKNVFICDFDSLFSDTNRMISDVQAFAGCSVSKLAPTMLGYDLGTKSMNYGTQKNDVADLLLKPHERELVILLEKIGRMSAILNAIILRICKITNFVVRIMRYVKKRIF